MKKKSEFDLTLDFQPQAKWPISLPAVALGTHLLTGFQHGSNHPVHQHSVKDLETHTDLFYDLYPSLGLCEIARLLTNPLFPELFSEESLLEKYGLHPSPDFKAVCKLLIQAPSHFQNWVENKKPGYHELIPLLGLNHEQQVFIMSQVVNSVDSKSSGAYRIEFLSDLLQIGLTMDSLLGLSLEELKQKRYPNTTNRDQKLSQISFHWPKAVRSRFSRQGDKGGFDIQFFAGTPLELTKTAQHLMKVAEEWNSNLDKNS